MDLYIFLQRILQFLNAVIVPLIFTLAFLFFIFNAVRYFIAGSANEEARGKAKSLAIWGITAFVFIVSIWGLVNVIGIGLGFSVFQRPITPDYIERGGDAGRLVGPGGTVPDGTATNPQNCVRFFLAEWCSTGQKIESGPGFPKPSIDPNVTNRVDIQIP